MFPALADVAAPFDSLGWPTGPNLT
jgi:hypothetical protein